MDRADAPDITNLQEEQNFLAGHQANSRAKHSEVEAKRRAVGVLEGSIRSMEGEVRRMRQRSETQELLKLYHIKRAVIEAIECEERVKTMQVSELRNFTGCIMFHFSGYC